MLIAPAAARAAHAPVTNAAPAAPFRPGTAGVAALMDVPGVGFLQLADTLTGYGRPDGYDSLANARRAAYQLSVGAESPAAGVYQHGPRFYVRALGAVAGKDPHGPGGEHPAPLRAAAPALQLLHFEGRTEAHFAWVRDRRLLLVVDGATRVWSKDAHHAPPKG